jgi:hypothetical protein
MTPPLVWLSFAKGNARCCWDQDIIDVIAPPTSFQHITCQLGDNGKVTFAPGDGAVFVIPARYNLEHVDRLNHYLNQYDWAVVILTSDEESLFPWRELVHRNIRIWVQSPRPDRHPSNIGLRFLPVGCPSQNADTLADIDPARAQSLMWFFSGQVNHWQRDEMLAAFTRINSGWGQASPGFTQGLERGEYLRRFAEAQIAPCPSGPASADSFRVWEALELGLVPVVDGGPLPDPEGRAVTDYPRGFWELLLGEYPFPRVDDWQQARKAIRSFVNEWPYSANRVFAWWQRKKWDLRQALLDDIVDLGGSAPTAPELTVLIPTSPVVGNPDTAHIEQTVTSVRERLPGCPIVLMFDGVRDEQERLRTAYAEYVRRTLWLANHHWGNCFPFVHGEHLHQAEMTVRALDVVRSPLILFVEHDTPLEGDVPWSQLTAPLLTDKVDVVRLYHEAAVQPEHEHLMGDHIGDFALTRQWSQRPHLARVDYYKRILRRFFSSRSRTMIEDRMHGAVQDESWEAHRLVVYLPEGNCKRSTHLDARESEPKYEMRL